MHAKSLASFESVENDVRTIAFAASSTTEINRVHSTSSVIASNRELTGSPSSCVERHDHVAGRGDREARPRRHDQGRAFFLDHRGPGEVIADGEAGPRAHPPLPAPRPPPV